MTSPDPLIVFSPSGKRGRFPVGTPVLQAARKLGVDLDSVCGGRGICSRCQITPSYGSFPKYQIESSEKSLSEWNAIEERYDRVRGLKTGRRLGCQAQILADIIVDVPPESQVHKQVVRKAADARPVTMDPSTRLYYVEVQKPDMHKPEGDLERVRNSLKEQWNIENVGICTSQLRILQQILRKDDFDITLAIWENHHNGELKITRVWSGFHEEPVFGLAIDLGSTTIAVHLCNLRDGSVLDSAGIMNPQIRFGEDLMSRVSYSMMNAGGDKELTDAVREGLNTVFGTIAENNNISLNSVLDVVIVCNPVMHHLLLGIDPVELGQAPFALAISSSLNLIASDLGLDSLEYSTPIYLFPCVAGHVGADAAGVILSEEPQKSDDKVLVVDVGTNAEIIFGDKTRVLACSSPTGPAFEGAQISSGQRASPGSIERVSIDPETKIPRFRVIGSALWSDEKGFQDVVVNTGVNGICGSGIIEAIAEMRMAGIIDTSGLIGSPEALCSNRIVADGRTYSYVLYEDAETGAPPIMVTQNDVRAIQLAKSALYAGTKLLMEKYGASKVDRIVLAGAFGSHISTKHAMVLGMIPDCQLDKVVSSGNAAGTGARIGLCNLEARREIEKTVFQIEKIETAVELKFQEHFVNANAIPHAVDDFPELNRIVNLPDSNHLAGAGKRRQRRQRNR
ncbi:MAG: ASKHA domain-containing protein [Rhodobacteraceae bacterium]|nr:ASKHA domain-containing protein [Paracoccaceae bacterium]MCY4250488.1 ASKHA domain-containing protein [Paracoccaceae bacterium]